MVDTVDIAAEARTPSSCAAPDACALDPAEAAPNLSVHIELPERRVMTEAELDVIETYFADLLDRVLGAGDGSHAASLRHKGLP
jgi:hypothetical protein